MKSILGISAFYHDSAATILVDGKIIAAAQEERFTRIKHDSSFPSNSIQYCIKEAGINYENIDYVVFSMNMQKSKWPSAGSTMQPAKRQEQRSHSRSLWIDPVHAAPFGQQ